MVQLGLRWRAMLTSLQALRASQLDGPDLDASEWEVPVAEQDTKVLDVAQLRARLRNPRQSGTVAALLLRPAPQRPVNGRGGKHRAR